MNGNPRDLMIVCRKCNLFIIGEFNSETVML